MGTTKHTYDLGNDQSGKLEECNSTTVRSEGAAVHRASAPSGSWLEDWVRSSLLELIPNDARMTMQAVSPQHVLIEVPGAGGGGDARTVRLHFDQGVHSSLVVATEESRRVMGSRLRELVERSAHQNVEPTDEVLDVYVDSAITARTPTCPSTSREELRIA